MSFSRKMLVRTAKSRWIIVVGGFLVLLGTFISIGFASQKPVFQTSTGEGIVVAAYQGGNFINQFFPGYEVFAVNLQGSEIEPPNALAKQMPDEMQWSPNHQWIVFSTANENAQAGGNSDIYLMPADGSKEGVPIANDSYNDVSPEWSPDGTTVSYANGGIKIVNVECIMNSNLCKLNPTLLIKEGAEHSWSPDGQKIVYSILYAMGSDKGGIFIMNIHSNERRVRISPEGDYCRRPQWSPSGDEIAFSCPDGLYTVNADGSSLNLLLKNAADPEWSPDGSQIAFIGGQSFDPELGQTVRSYGAGSGVATSTAVFLVDKTGANIRRLTSNNYQEILQFRWLPSTIIRQQP